MQGDRYNKGKTKWSLVDWESLEPLVQVLDFGSNKYAAYNWQKGLKVRETMESCLRHIFSFLSGEDNDKESGLTHLGHAMCNLHFATWMLKHRPDMDDRLKKEETQLKLNLFDEPLTTPQKGCTEVPSRYSRT